MPSVGESVATGGGRGSDAAAGFKELHTALRSAVQKLFPPTSSCNMLKRELSLMLLEDPDFRLRVGHAEDLVKVRLPGLAQQQQSAAGASRPPLLAPALNDQAHGKYFIVDAAGEPDWPRHILRINVVELLKRSTIPVPGAVIKSFEAKAKAAAAAASNSSQSEAAATDSSCTSAADGTACGVQSEGEDASLLAAVEATWPNYQEDDDEYLAVVISYILITKALSQTQVAGKGSAATKVQVPSCSLHLTDVGGWLRTFSATDARLAGIFPRAGVGRRSGKRPRLSEFLLQPRFRPYFRLRESGLRKSEKLVSLAVDKIQPAAPEATQTHQSMQEAAGSACMLPYPGSSAGQAMATAYAGGMQQAHPLSGLPTSTWDVHTEPLDMDSSGLPQFLFDYEAGVDSSNDMTSEAGTDRDQYEHDMLVVDPCTSLPIAIRSRSRRSSVSGTTSQACSYGASETAAMTTHPLQPLTRVGPPYGLPPHPPGHTTPRWPLETGHTTYGADRYAAAASAGASPPPGVSLLSCFSGPAQGAGTMGAVTFRPGSQEGPGVLPAPAGMPPLALGSRLWSSELVLSAKPLSSAGGSGLGTSPSGAAAAAAGSRFAYREMFTNSDSSLFSSPMVDIPAKEVPKEVASCWNGLPVDHVTPDCASWHSTSPEVSSIRSVDLGCQDVGAADAHATPHITTSGEAWNHGLAGPSHYGSHKARDGSEGQSHLTPSCLSEESEEPCSHAQADLELSLEAILAAGMPSPAPTLADLQPIAASAGPAVDGARVLSLSPIAAAVMVDQLLSPGPDCAAEEQRAHPRHYEHHSQRPSATKPLPKSFASVAGQAAAEAAAAVEALTVAVTRQASQPSAGTSPAASADKPASGTPTSAPSRVITGWAAIAAKDPAKAPASAAPATSKPGLPAASKAGAMPGKPVADARAGVKVSARIKAEIDKLLQTVKGLQAESFDDGVLYQLSQKRSEEEAVAALRSLASDDLSGIQHLAAYINHVVKHFRQGEENGAGSSASATVRANSMPVSSKAILQKLPLRVYKRLEDVVNRCTYMEWKHFDAGVIKVMAQLSEVDETDVLEELDLLESTDLSNVEYMPAYLNKRLNNRLWSRRKNVGEMAS